MSINGVVVICLAILVGGLGVFLIFMGFLSLQQGKQIKSWKSVAGRVTRSTLEEKRVETSHEDGVKRTEVGYAPMVEFEYRVEGQSIIGRRINMVEKQDTQKAGQKVLTKYPVGATIQVHYDPDNPQESVLETGTGASSIIFILGGLVLVVVGIAITIFGK